MTCVIDGKFRTLGPPIPSVRYAATHNGETHPDDVFAWVILRRVRPELTLIRTRDPVVIEHAEVVFDVGMELCFATRRFDHHQPEGAGARPNGVPYAAAGLLWQAFGLEYVVPYAIKYGVSTRALWSAVDGALFQAVDAADNHELEGMVPNLVGSGIKVPMKTISEIIFRKNPLPGLEDTSVEGFDKRFFEIADFAESVLEDTIRSEVAGLLAETAVKEADTRGPILVLDSYHLWEPTVAKLEYIKLVVHPSPTGNWICKAASAGTDFELRIKLPSDWAGLRDEPLQTLTGVEDAVFAHRRLYVCGAKSREGALALARLALESHYERVAA